MTPTKPGMVWHKSAEKRREERILVRMQQLLEARRNALYEKGMNAAQSLGSWASAAASLGR